MKKVFLFLLFICASMTAQVKPNAFDWADNPESYTGKTIILNAYYSRENRSVIYQQEGSSSSGTLYCYKEFKEQKTGENLVVNIPQKFWENNGKMIPKEMGAGLYKLTLKVSSEKPQDVCDGNWVGGSGSNRIFYTLVAISRYNL
jgi:hypothetical protein